MMVFLVPAGGDRFELYSEVPVSPAPQQPTGWFQRWVFAAQAQWHDLVDAAKRGGGRGRFARWRDRTVSALAESIAEQRTLWALRNQEAATLRMPASLSQEQAQSVLTATFSHARRHHLRWLIIDGLLFIASGILAIVPGPNLVAYYFAFRLVGHLQAWRGARQAMDRITWRFVPEPDLAELSLLVDEPRDTRTPKVEAIARRLELPHLAAFFDRVAVPSG
jgi:hypothetical protein